MRRYILSFDVEFASKDNLNSLIVIGAILYDTHKCETIESYLRGRIWSGRVDLWVQENVLSHIEDDDCKYQSSDELMRNFSELFFRYKDNMTHLVYLGDTYERTLITNMFDVLDLENPHDWYDQNICDLAHYLPAQEQVQKDPVYRYLKKNNIASTLIGEHGCKAHNPLCDAKAHLRAFMHYTKFHKQLQG